MWRVASLCVTSTMSHPHLNWTSCFWRGLRWPMTGDMIWRWRKILICGCFTSALLGSVVVLSVFLPIVYAVCGYSQLCYQAEGRDGGRDLKKPGGSTGKDGIYVNMLVGRTRIYPVPFEDWCYYTRSHLDNLDSFDSVPHSLFSPLFLFTFVSGSDYS